MDRLDSFDKMPSGMRNYLSSYGYHFSKKMCEWAVSKMKKNDENGKMKSIEPYTNDDTHQLLKKYNVSVQRDEAYDICYLANMFKADFLGKSLPNEQYLAMHIKAYQDDPDGNPTRAFDEFLANCIAKGIPIIWDDMM